MTVGIIPEGRKPLPRGLLVRPLVMAALGAGVYLTWDAQTGFVRPGAATGLSALALLGLSYLPYLVAIPLLWRLGGGGRGARMTALAVAALLAGSTYLAFQQAFVLNRSPTSGLVFFTLPAGQTIALALLFLFARRREGVSAPEGGTAGAAAAAG